MEQARRRLAQRLRRRIAGGKVTAREVRVALSRIPPPERDAFVDRLFELGPVPDDGPQLPRGCVPYLPCPVDTLQRAMVVADVRPSDVVIDIGSGAGRTAALMQLLTSARVIGVEVQQELVEASRRLMQRLKLARFLAIHGDANAASDQLGEGTVFFLYCPFSGERLETLLSSLEAIARSREIRICLVDLPLPPCPFLTRVARPRPELAVYRSTLHASVHAALD